MSIPASITSSVHRLPSSSARTWRQLRRWFLTPQPAAPEPSAGGAWKTVAGIVLAVTLVKWIAAETFLSPYDLSISPWRFGYEAGHIAGNLAAGSGFSIQTGRGGHLPTAWMSPAYPLLLSLVFRGFGSFSEAAAHATVALNCFFQGLCAGLLFLMGDRLGGRRTGHVAAIAMLANPGGWQFIDWAWPTHLFALALLVHVHQLLRVANGGRGASVLSGASLGGALLVDGAAISLAPVTALVLALAGERDRARRRLAAGLLALAFVIAPWAARNAATLGVMNPLRGNVGVNLWVGNHPGARAESFHGMSQSPWHRRSEGDRMAAMGEQQYDRWCREQALAEIATRPGDFALHSAMRFSGFWLAEWWSGYRHVAWPYTAGHIALTALAGLGAWRTRRRGLGFLLAAVILFAVPYALTVHGHGRYRVPIEPILCLLAGLALLPSKQRAEDGADLPSESP